MSKSLIAAVIYRLVFAALSLTAVIVQLVAVHIPKGYSVVNFFCYFTNLSNLMLSIVFIISVVRILRDPRVPSERDVAIRGGVIVYIVFVGIVFNTLLADGDLGDILPWVNVVVHIVIPIVGLADWIIWPPRRRLPFTVTLWWLIWPAVYSIFSVTRGAITGFYPYPFFNPNVSGGYGGVALWCLVLVIAFFVLAVIIRLIGNARSRTGA